MTEPTQDLSLAQAYSLIDSYAFDLGDDDVNQLLQSWLEVYHANWIKLATIEALYLGRYKAVSIEHILNVWLRMGTPNPHFTYEFERLICRKLPKHLSALANLTTKEDPTPIPEFNQFNYQSHPTSTTEIDLINPLANNQHQISTYEGERLNFEPALDNIDSFPEDEIPLVSAFGLPYQANWSELTLGSKTIHQFIPLPDVSSFFNKLKTFGQEKLEG